MNEDAEMFGYWLILLSSANQILQHYDNQGIAKKPIVIVTPATAASNSGENSVITVQDSHTEAAVQVVPLTMVGILDGTIDFIDNIFKAGAPAKTEILIRNKKNPHGKGRKDKAYAYVEYY